MSQFRMRQHCLGTVVLHMSMYERLFLPFLVWVFHRGGGKIDRGRRKRGGRPYKEEEEEERERNVWVLGALFPSAFSSSSFPFTPPRSTNSPGCGCALGPFWPSKPGLRVGPGRPGPDLTVRHPESRPPVPVSCRSDPRCDRNGSADAAGGWTEVGTTVRPYKKRREEEE